MTREEAIQEVNKVFEPAFANYIITALTDGTTVSEQEPILDKIRAEIGAIEDGISSYHNDRPWIFKDEALAIIDKYKAEMESEE